MLGTTLGVILISLLLYFVYRAYKINQYWKERGIKFIKPHLFFGNTLPIILNKKTIQELHIDVRNTFPDEDFVGFYDSMKPLIILQSADYIQRVLIKDFQHFTDHGFIEPDEEKHPIDAYQLFTMRGLKWRAFRSKMSPLFTTGKLKYMFDSFQFCGQKLKNYLEKHPKKDIAMRDVIQLFVLELVGLAVFGFDGKVFDNPDSEFRKNGTNIFDSNYFKLILTLTFPKLGTKLGLTFNRKEAVDYFCKVISDTFEHRKKNGIERNDFIQMMMQLKEKGKIDIQKWDTSDDYLKMGEQPSESYEITDIKLMAQAYTFMTTGVDAVSLSLQWAFYEIARNEEVQNKLRAEIKEQIKLNSELDYNAITKATYLDNVVSEVLRLYPVSLVIFRVCTKKYTFPNGYTVNVGDYLHIPVMATHLNPNYFSDPLVFKPERFQQPVMPGTYFPFGDGPRICIAMRFALLQMKYVLAVTILNYKITLSEKVKIPYKLKPKAIFSQPEEPFLFNLEKIAD